MVGQLSGSARAGVSVRSCQLRRGIVVVPGKSASLLLIRTGLSCRGAGILTKRWLSLLLYWRSKILPVTLISTAMALQVYGIPNCGTCKKAFSWLESNGVSYDFIDTKTAPPTRAMIADWVAALGSKPMQNTSGQAYRAIGEEKKTWSDEQWIAAFADNAMLLKRPLFVKDGQAVLVGFRAKEDVLQTTLNG